MATASYVTNRGLQLLASADFDAIDFRALLIINEVAAATGRDHNFIDAVITAGTEATCTGYARKTLAGITVTESDASDNVTLTAAAPTYTAVAVGEVWEAVAYYIEGASDAARVLIGVDTPAATVTTNGGNITGPALSVTVTGS